MNGLNIKTISIIGGGNIGTQFACIAASKFLDVTVYTSKRFSNELSIVDENNRIICDGKIKNVTFDISVAMMSDMVLVTTPAFMFDDIASKMEPFARKGQYIGVLPGTGGAEFSFKGIVEKGGILFGLQRVPSVARLIEYGKTVCMEGKRDCIYLASIPKNSAKDLAEFRFFMANGTIRHLGGCWIMTMNIRIC